ncbi:GlxA family transcriptional regulator [Klebsiella aerogenes]|uniref:GlxA family transcriptional regulator n=1 Tax=Klebsiella aerogenes TaxID=548 RepID=UPI00244CE9E4|nr:GlxA family transcriptional regulator [Klebsiella aerogenes]MDH1612420.1 GlxA family transcriptional regulator [Klebsiella aerogenes]
MAATLPVKSKSGRPLSVGFILLNRFTLLPFAAFVDCLRLAADEGDRSRQLRCSWTFMSCDGGEAVSSCGAAISPCVALKSPESFDYIVVIGGVQDEQDKTDRRALDYIRLAVQFGTPLVGLCTGVFALIQAGVMKGKQCCVSWYHHGDLQRRFPDIMPVADRIFVDEGALITCAGGVAAADVAAYLIERHLGRAWAIKSLHIMLIDEARATSHPQPQPVIFEKITDRLVRSAVDIISQHMGEVVSVEQLAQRLNTSRRNIERKFQEELGISPQRFARDLRLRYGLWLLLYTVKSVTEIGERCGFSDAAHFSRHFRDAFGYPPSVARKQIDRHEQPHVDPFFIHIDSRIKGP